MKFHVPLAAAVLALAFVPVASASVGAPQAEADTCILYPWTIYVGGYYVSTPYVIVPGQSYTILFLTVTTQTVTVTPLAVYVPYVTSATTPGVCWGDVSRIVDQFADIQTLA